MQLLQQLMIMSISSCYSAYIGIFGSIKLSHFFRKKYGRGYILEQLKGEILSLNVEFH